jgi:hypothetical protein
MVNHSAASHFPSSPWPSAISCSKPNLPPPSRANGSFDLRIRDLTVPLFFSLLFCSFLFSSTSRLNPSYFKEKSEPLKMNEPCGGASMTAGFIHLISPLARCLGGERPVKLGYRNGKLIHVMAFFKNCPAYMKGPYYTLQK